MNNKDGRKVTEFPASRIKRIPVNLPTGPGAPWTAAEVKAFNTTKAREEV